MQNSIKALISHKKTINVWWLTTMRCNYSCWYCASFANNLPGDRFKSWDDYVIALSYLRLLWPLEETIVITLTGGEPLLYKDWDKFLKTKFDNMIIHILTNLSLPLNIIKDRLDGTQGKKNFTVSYHASFCDINVLLPKLLYLKEKNYLNCVKILNDTRYTEKVNEAYKICVENDLSVVFTYLDNQVEENAIIGSTVSIENSSKSTKIQKDLEVVYEDSSVMVDSNYLYTNELNNFKGMLCELGQRNLYIDYQGNAFPSACMLNFKKTNLGNIYKQNIKLYTKPKTCPFNFCACGSDFEFSKWDKVYYEELRQQTS